MSNHLEFSQCRLVPVDSSNIWFIKTLFQDADIKKYYVLSTEHTADIKGFCQFLLTRAVQERMFNFIIYNNSAMPVGFISAKPEMNSFSNSPMWNMSYAISPAYRRRGYAADAVQGLTNFLLHNFSIPQVMLDINEKNIASIAVARKCGFKKPTVNFGYIDFEHPDMGMRMRWFKQLNDKRAMYFNQAAQAYRQKNYAEAIDYFNQALNESYQSGTPFTDAQIYANIGMAFSSIKQYATALNYLKKAKSLGLNNPSIERELQWLRNNVGIY